MRTIRTMLQLNGHLSTTVTFFCPRGGRCGQVQLYHDLTAASRSNRQGAHNKSTLFNLLKNILKQIKSKAIIFIYTPSLVWIIARLDLTENFHHEHFIDPTNCPWVSEDVQRVKMVENICGVM